MCHLHYEVESPSYLIAFEESTEEKLHLKALLIFMLLNRILEAGGQIGLYKHHGAEW